MSKPIDVTDRVRFGNPDDEMLPLRVCVCGAKFKEWDRILSIYETDPTVMDCCGARLYFRNSISVFQKDPEMANG